MSWHMLLSYIVNVRSLAQHSHAALISLRLAPWTSLMQQCFCRGGKRRDGAVAVVMNEHPSAGSPNPSRRRHRLPHR